MAFITKSHTQHNTTGDKPQTLAQQIAIVTGASSGIGAATAWELAQRGARVVLAARRVAELETQANAISAAGYRAIAIPTDVTDTAQVTHLAQQTIEMFGRVDILVNNAGIALGRSFRDTPIQEITRILNVNLLGAILCTQAILPGMLERHHGSIISVASVAAHLPIDPLYCATKYGLRGFSLSLQRELVNSGVSASIVSPGFVRTPMNEHMPLRMPGPEIIAKAIADLAVHPRREVVVPWFYNLMIAGEHAFPSVADHIIRLTRHYVEM